MRIERLDLVRYGAFANRTIDFGTAPKADQPDLHIVFGPNEAGKSTLFSAWLDLLFGEIGDDYAFDHKRETLEIRAELGLDRGRRSVTRTGATDLRRDDEDAVHAALAGLERSDYATMFSLDTDELESGGRAILASEGRLGELLFSAGTGLSRLSDVLTTTRAEAEEIYKYGGKKSEMATLRAEMIALDQRIRDADLQADEHRALIEQRDATRAASERADEALRDVRGELKGVERLLHALSAEDDRRAAMHWLAQYGELPEVPREWHERIGALAMNAARRAERERMIARAREDIRREREELTTDEAAYAVASKLGALDAMRDERGVPIEHRMSSGSGDLATLREKLREAARTVSEKRERLGVTHAGGDDVPIVAREVTETLRELAEQRSALTERLETTGAEVSRAMDAHAAAQDAVRDLVGDGETALDPEAMRMAVSTVRSVARSGVVSAWREAERAAARERAALATLLERDGVKGDPRTIACPSGARIEMWRERDRELHARRDRLAERMRALETERASIEARRVAAAVPSDEDVQRVRAERERAWNKHRGALDAITADAFAAALAADDTMIARRLAAADQLASLRSDAARAATIESELAAVAKDVADAEHAAADLRDEIATALLGASRAGLVPATPDLTNAIEFTERHAAWVAMQQSLDTADAELASSLGDATRAIESLADRLPIDLPADDPLVALDAAEAWIEEARAQSEQLASMTRRLREREADLHAREAAQEAARERLDRWNAQWDQALGSTFLSSDSRTSDVDGAPRVGVVLGLIDAADELATAAADHRALEGRIRSIEADRNAFLRALQEIAGTLEIGRPDAENWNAVLQSVRARVASACKAHETAEALDRRQGETDQSARALEREAKDDEAAFAPIREALQCSEPSAAAPLLDRIRERDEWREKANNALRRIADELETDAESALATIEAADRDALGARRDDLVADEVRVSAERDEARDSYAQARKALSDVGGDGTAARLIAERQTLAERLAERAVHALTLELGIEAATLALSRYREAHRSAMMAHASDAFARISCGAFGGLEVMPGKDGDTLGARRPGSAGRVIGIQPPKAKRGKTRGRGEGGLSKGTRHQLYLALRMAGYHEYAAQRTPPPFVCDDVMETFDDERSIETLRLFADMATKGQVIVLTHHRHLVDLARATVPGVRCHDLPGPGEMQRPPLAIAAE